LNIDGLCGEIVFDYLDPVAAIWQAREIVRASRICLKTALLSSRQTAKCSGRLHHSTGRVLNFKPDFTCGRLRLKHREGQKE
jgi:hypothetical protein